MLAETLPIGRLLYASAVRFHAQTETLAGLRPRDLQRAVEVVSSDLGRILGPGWLQAKR